MAIFDPIDWQLLKQSVRHFFIVIGFFFFAVLLDIGIGFCERWNLTSSELSYGMRQTALIIFRIDQGMVVYMVAMAAFVLMIKYTRQLWARFL